MPVLSEATRDTVASLKHRLASRLGAAPTLVDASKCFVELLVQQFGVSVVLARVYAMLPFGRLPPDEQAWVRKLAGPAAQRIGAGTPVLSLMGTHGRLPQWSDRIHSRGHRGIPLIDANFTNAIPMVARMLAELGANLDLLALPDIPIKMFLGGFNGLFYVPDAATALDRQGRRVIPADDFVSTHNVRTVFGMGGSYLGDEAIVAIFFCSELVERSVAEHFGSLIQQFKISTTRLIGMDRIFS